MRRHLFQPPVESWLRKAFGGPTPVQAKVWDVLPEGRHLLMAAPTGAGKTLAAFLGVIDDLVCKSRSGGLTDGVQVVYVSPLKALGNDIQKNLEIPLAGIREELESAGWPDVEIRVAVRTGDTPAAVRAAMKRLPPQILVTTPESLYLMLTSDGGRDILKSARTVIVDEIHALAGTKRGAHLSLSLERLTRLTGQSLRRIGLSATQEPLREVGRFLIGTEAAGDQQSRLSIVDEGHVRQRDLAIELPSAPLEAVLSTESANETYDRIAQLIEQHRTTLVFVNTRRLAERVAKALADRLGAEAVTSHHGSMAKESRLQAEQRLKGGELRALVATASLELGIDIGEVDLVCQIGTTRSLATLLQRVGRSGHRLGALPKGRVFPQTRDELVECAALLDMTRRGELDLLQIAGPALDVLAQQIVAAVSCEEFEIDVLFALCTAAYCYRGLSRSEFDKTLRMLAEGYAFARGRRSAYLHVDAVNGKVRPRIGARLVAIACGGAIPDTADYDVILEPSGQLIGTVNEDFAIESLPGSIFQLGNTAWQVLKVDQAAVRVADAQGQPPNMPFWLGEAPARSRELSGAVARLRAEFQRATCTVDIEQRKKKANAWLRELGLGVDAVSQLSDYLIAGEVSLGAMPTQDTLVIERFFDESEGMQLVIHSPFGSRLNRAWGLALRKRFCRQFNFELQAAAVEDAIVLSLGAVHSFPLDDVWRYLKSNSVREILTQALLDAPMFTVRWRWVACCALAIQRNRHGKRTPPRLLRMYADDLATCVFPDQLACAENLSGARDIPDHPLVTQAIDDCLEEVMDCRGLEALLAAIERGEKTLVSRDLTSPSPFAQAVLNANPYAFLDDAPLEERRTQAVKSRRWLDADSARDLGALDPAAIQRVRTETWPSPRSKDELQEALTILGAISPEVLASFDTSQPPLSLDRLCAWFEELRNERRAYRMALHGGRRQLWVNAEFRISVSLLWPAAYCMDGTPAIGNVEQTVENAAVALLRGWLEVTGPVTTDALATLTGLPAALVEQSLLALEGMGVVLRGAYSVGADPAIEWCERRLLARIHRYTLNRLRAEIELVSGATFMNFLFEWQLANPQARVEGQQATQKVLEMLSGFHAPADAWESMILPSRVADYHGGYLDRLTASGRFRWIRADRPFLSQGSSFTRVTPITLLGREDSRAWTFGAEGVAEITGLSGAAAGVRNFLSRQGASFFEDIAHETRLLPSQCEDALAELAANGLVTSDGISGLRVLLTPASKRRSLSGSRHRRAAAGFEDTGRWFLTVSTAHERTGGPSSAEVIARALIRRYGIVFRKLVERETIPIPWLEVLRELRRLEARGELRGGRFVAGFSGEQFALPEAIPMLRKAREQRQDSIQIVSAADPLNLAGVILPGIRIPANNRTKVAFLHGEAVAVRLGSELNFLQSLPFPDEIRIRTALMNQPNGKRRVTFGRR